MKLYTFGSNFASQLGDTQPRPIPHIPILHPFFTDKTIDKLACGIMHTLVLIENKVYSWGCNDEFALGRDGDEHIVLEVFIKEKVIEICAGLSHSVCLTEKGNVYAWGTFRNSSGVVGFSFNTKYQKKPKLIEKNILAISSCDNNFMMIRNTYSILCYGPNLLNNNSQKQKSRSVLRSRIVMRYSKNKPKIQRLYAGSSHCIGLCGDKVFAWGNNACGQFGNGSKVSSNDLIDTGIMNVRDVCAGSIHTIFMKGNDVYACGTNECNQLGYECKEALSPVKIISDVQMMAAKESCNIVVKENIVYSWGSNFSGELGFPAGVDVVTPQKIDFDFGEIVMIGLGNDHCVVVSK